jgi:uncharacterized protein
MKNSNRVWRVGGLVAFLTVFVSLAVAGDVDRGIQEKSIATQKRQDIRRLMVLTGSGDIGIQASRQMMASLKPAFPSVPDTFWDEFQKEMNPDALIELVVPIYDKHLSHADIKELIKFYETPVGKRMVKALPVIMKDSMAAGQKWGEDIAKRAVKRMKEKGYQVDQ